VKIKEVAKVCGLTEKAIRLYESKELIKPLSEEKNGRIYREYDDETVTRLRTISILRRASFSLEQIKEMLLFPFKTKSIFDDFLKTEEKELKFRSSLFDFSKNIDTDSLNNVDTLADILAVQLGFNTPHIVPEGNDTPVTFSVWDEDISSDEKKSAYLRFLSKQNKKDKISDFFEQVKNKASVIFVPLKKIKMKSAICLVVISLLLFSLVSAHVKNVNMMNEAAYDIFHTLKEICSFLKFAYEQEKYDYQSSELVCTNIYKLSYTISFAESLHYKQILSSSSIRELSTALGCRYAAIHTYENVEAILKDGKVSEKEYQFIKYLCNDIESLYTTMLSEDGTNPKKNLKYSQIRYDLKNFADKWGNWSWSSDAPYELLQKE